jgi:DNA-binding FrmR family transcriptional regulator
MEAVERALESDCTCAEVLQIVTAARGAMNGLMVEVIEDHIREHVASPDIKSNAERQRGADELVEVVRSYMK